MKNVSTGLLHTIRQVMPLLRSIPEATASEKPAPNKWSYKEIIGHLLDSACNNQQKLVRTILQPEHHFLPYAQDEWVAAQHYQDADWLTLLNFWEQYNIHIAHIIAHIPEASLSHKIYINDKGPYTLEFIAGDYVEHLKHHLLAILPAAEFLRNGFKMVY
jgi:hypothetical protein